MRRISRSTGSGAASRSCLGWRVVTIGRSRARSACGPAVVPASSAGSSPERVVAGGVVAGDVVRRLTRRVGRRTPVRTRARARRRGFGVKRTGSGREPAQLSRSVQPDQDLTEQPLEPRWFPAGSQGLHGGLRHGAGSLRGRERPLVESLGWREQAGSGDQVRVARDARGRPGARRSLAFAARGEVPHQVAPSRRSTRSRPPDRRDVRPPPGSPRKHRRWPRRPSPPARRPPAGRHGRRGPWTVRRPPANERPRRPATTMGRAGWSRQGRRSAAVRRPRGRVSTP